MNTLSSKYSDGRLQAVLAAAAGNAGVLNLVNDTDETFLITDVSVRITTPVAGQTFDCGVGTAGASLDNLIDGGSLAAAARLNNALNPGANGKARQYWLPGQAITITASGTPTGLAGTVDVHARRVN